MTKNKNCETGKKSTTIECSDRPEMFITEKIWGGRKDFVTECLSHAVASEQRGQKSDVIRH